MPPPKVLLLIQKYPDLRAAFYPSLPPCELSEQAPTTEEGRESTPEKENFVDPWKIKKKLKQSDLDFQQCRLLISTKALEENLFPYLDSDRMQQIKQKLGLTVSMRDCDTGHVFELKLKFWPSSKSYAFVDGWRKNFVERRRLNRSDEIAIFWCERKEQIFFSLLQRAPRAVNQ